jgi:fumarate reductase flavoprotein subunit
MQKYDARGERATRDIVSRAIFAEMREGRTSAHGGVYLAMGHLGADAVRRQFKGMVERCADCGFVVAAGRVEVVPTAQYLLVGVEFGTDCTTEREGLYVAGEDSGGVHGANRLGGNGVANSTVFGGIAGDAMAAALRDDGAWREPDLELLRAAWVRACLPFNGSAAARADAASASGAAVAGGLEHLRERLYATMWEDAGIVRDAAGLARAAGELAALAAQLSSYRLPAPATDPAFNLAWHDWLNLGNLVSVSQAIVRAAQARENSRGAHFRADFPDAGELAASDYTRVRLRGGMLAVERGPVRFARVRPGETLL